MESTKIKNRVFDFFQIKKNRVLVLSGLFAIAVILPFVANNYILEVMSNVVPPPVRLNGFSSLCSG